ncbi:MAG: hypothetical protein AAGF31_03535 [Planctomycetota bacterium]
MFTRLLLFASAGGAAFAASLAAGHGTPIDLKVVNGALSVSHVPDGYAPFVFGQQAEESDPQGPINLPGLGSSLVWDLPGIDIVGMTGSASLSLEVMAPTLGGLTSDSPTFDSNEQTLWYWDAATQTVEPTPADAALDLLLSDGSSARLDNASPLLPPTVLLADTVAGQTGFHNHSLLNFAMPYTPPLDLGVYGFFARFTSESYSPSEWFLTIFNLGTAYDDLAPASEAMWGLAFPGDYDRDGEVTVLDHQIWASEYGSQVSTPGAGADGNGDGIVDIADFTVWRDALAPPPPGANQSVAVPEPVASLFAWVWGLYSAVTGRRRRKRRETCTLM